MKDWIPLINKLIWPFIIGILLLVFHDGVSEIYDAILDRIKAGGSIEIGGFFKLGDEATKTEIKELSSENLSIKGIGETEGAEGEEGIEKDSLLTLWKLKEELANDPTKTINTLLVADDIQDYSYSVELCKEYISTLGLRYVVFQKGDQFAGWMYSGSFVAQLPSHNGGVGFTEMIRMHGIKTHFVDPDFSTKKVLEQMQKFNLDSIPVVDDNGKWLFFANRDEILARLMTSIILSNGE